MRILISGRPVRVCDRVVHAAGNHWTSHPFLCDTCTAEGGNGDHPEIIICEECAVSDIVLALVAELVSAAVIVLVSSLFRRWLRPGVRTA